MSETANLFQLGEAEPAKVHEDAPAPDPDALPEELASYVDEELGEKWSIQSLTDADWALRRVAAFEEEIAENKAVVEEEIAILKLKLEALNRTAQRGLAFFTWHLTRWAKANKDILLKGGKKKSRGLPHGTIGWRQKGGLLKVSNPDALLTWALSMPAELELVRIKEEPAVANIKAWVEAEEGLEKLPPGLEVEPTRDELEIKAVRQMPKKGQSNE